jgi:hypothetical protein
MNTPHVVTPWAAIVVGGLTYAAFSTSTFKAQAQQSAADTNVNTSLKAKVEKLEKQVRDLERKIAQLQRQSGVQPSPAVPQRAVPQRGTNKPLRRRQSGVQLLPPLSQRDRNGVPRNWKPFVFNGGTYYLIPVDKGKQPVAGSVQQP